MKRSKSTSPVPETSKARKLSRSAPSSRSASPALTLRPATPPVTDKICLCHVHKDEVRDFRQFTSKTWKSFRDAAQYRKDPIAMSMESEWTNGPSNGYHMHCFQTYITRSKKLPTDIDQPSSSKLPIEAEEKQEAKKLRSSSSTTVTQIASPSKKATKPCIVCGKHGRKRVKKEQTWVWELLSLCVTDDASNRLKISAKAKGNFIMLAELEGTADAMAGDIMYHHSCYRKFPQYGIIVKENGLSFLRPPSNEETSLFVMGCTCRYNPSANPQSQIPCKTGPVVFNCPIFFLSINKTLNERPSCDVQIQRYVFPTPSL